MSIKHCSGHAMAKSSEKEQKAIAEAGSRMKDRRPRVAVAFGIHPYCRSISFALIDLNRIAMCIAWQKGLPGD